MCFIIKLLSRLLNVISPKFSTICAMFFTVCWGAWLFPSFFYISVFQSVQLSLRLKIEPEHPNPLSKSGQCVMRKRGHIFNLNFLVGLKSALLFQVEFPFPCGNMYQMPKTVSQSVRWQALAFNLAGQGKFTSACNNHLGIRVRQYRPGLCESVSYQRAFSACSSNHPGIKK